MNSVSVKELAKLGADLVITGDAGYSPGSVKEIIEIASQSGAHITVHASKYSLGSLKEMIAAGDGNVSIVI